MTTLETQLQEAIDARYEALGRAAEAERRAIVAEAECARLLSQRRILAHHLRMALLDWFDTQRELRVADKALSILSEEVSMSISLWAFIGFKRWIRQLSERVATWWSLRRALRNLEGAHS